MALLLALVVASLGIVLPLRATGAADGGNLVRDGSFGQPGAWAFVVRGAAAGTFARERAAALPGSSAAAVRIIQPAPSAPWDVQLGQGGIPLRRGQPVTLSFYARAAAGGGVSAVLQHSTPPYAVYAGQSFAPTADWQRFALTYDPSASDASALLAFNFAAAGGTVELSGVRLEPAPAGAGSLLTPVSGGADSGRPTTHSQIAANGWQLVWDDEFDGAALDTTKWNVVSAAPRGYTSCCLGDGLQYWDPSAVAVRDGRLVLTSARQPAGGRQYTSGAVTTEGKFALRYGRIDIRAQLPRGNGLWSAFWLLPAGEQVHAYASHEIDMMETLGQDPHTVYVVNHWSGQYHQYCDFSGPDFSAAAHDFSLVWQPGSIDWYVDGVRQCHLTQGVPDQAMYLLLNTYVGGSWPTPPDSSTAFPQYTSIDYVRVYQWT